MTGPGQDFSEELHVLAGEYVLGALDATEMSAVRRQAMRDPTLAAAIAGWEGRLAPMAGAVPEVTPPDALWSRIEEAIAPVPDDVGDAPAARQPRFATLVPAADPGPDQPQEMPPPRRRVWPWQFATVASLALAAGIAGLVLVPSLAVRLDMPMLAARFNPEVAVLLPAENLADARSDGNAPQMASDTGTARLVEPRPEGTPPPAPPNVRDSGFLAEAQPDGVLAVKALTQVAVPVGKSLELWIMAPGAAAPKSLGALPPAGRRVPLPAMPAAGATLLVSLEPPGGSPTGAPTGPVVYSGKLSRLEP